MGNPGRDAFFFEGYTLDPTRGCVRNENREIELRAKSFELLSYLVTNAGRLISKDELVNAVWPNVIVSDDSLAQCVSDVRQALNDADRRIIKTVPRRGYLFAAPVSVQPPHSAAGPPFVGPSDIADRQDNPGGALALGPMGEHNAKNIARPVSVYALPAAAVASTPLAEVRSQSDAARRRVGPLRTAVAVSVPAVIGIGIVAWWAWPHQDAPAVSHLPPAGASPQITRALTSAPAPRLSIVVLPFTNLSNDPDQEYFADGITDDLTTDLSRISESFVIARSTAFTYKGKAVDAKQIGHDLGVRYVVEGSVRRGGDQILVNVQLVDAESGAHVWADRFETDRRSLVEAQSEITGRLARTLNLELVRESGRRSELERAVDPDARDLVMRGWARGYAPFSATSTQEAAQYFERALEIDPRSVDARIGLATVLLGRMGLGWASPRKEDLARVEQLLLEALERDTNRSSAHQAMGILRRNQVRLNEAKVEFETAIALDRSNARAFFQLGNIMVWLGEPEAGIPHLEKAIRLNPHDQTLASHFALLGLCHLFLGHVDQAIDLMRKARAENPRSYVFHLWLAGALGFKGDLDEAKAALAESLKLKPELNSFAAQRAEYPYIANPPHWALREKTLNVGLRRIGFPEE